MSKHTPAPWKLRRAEHSLEHDFILHAGPHIIAWSVPRADRSNTRKKSEHIANARLIAAAPELLEALKDARRKLAWFTDSYPQDIVVSESEFFGPIDAAITKAEGPAS